MAGCNPRARNRGTWGRTRNAIEGETKWARKWNQFRSRSSPISGIEQHHELRNLCGFISGLAVRTLLQADWRDLLG